MDFIQTVFRVNYAHSAQGVTLDLSTSSFFTGGVGGDAQGDQILFDVQNGMGVIGSTHADTLRGSAVVGSYLKGNGGADTIIGNSLNDTIVIKGTPALIDGGFGQDLLMIYGRGDAVVRPDAGTVLGFERVVVRDGATVDFSLQADSVGVGTIVLRADGGVSTTVTGTQGADRILGGGGADVIAGGGGADVVRGGAGADRFVFSAAGDFGTDRLDRILDFSGSAGDGDRIDLSALGFTRLETAPFADTGEAQLRARQGAPGVWTVTGDVDGDGALDFTLRVLSDAPLTGADFAFAKPEQSPDQAGPRLDSVALASFADPLHPVDAGFLA